MFYYLFRSRRMMISEIRWCFRRGKHKHCFSFEKRGKKRHADGKCHVVRVSQLKPTNLRRLALMKLGPCLRNSVFSPKSGHPIVPGGRPRRRLYCTSFHRSSRLLAITSPRTMPSTASISAIATTRREEIVPRRRSSCRCCCSGRERTLPFI
jgi:hypothetical protein